jgi:hypothetical protein
MLNVGKLWAMKEKHGLSGFLDFGGCSVTIPDQSRIVVTKSEKKDKNGRDYYLVFFVQDDPTYGKTSRPDNAPSDDIPF